MHRSTLGFLLLLPFLAACGGGGGGAAPTTTASLPLLDFGLVPGNGESRDTFDVTNNSAESATVTDISTPGDFSLSAEGLPLTIPAGDTAAISVTFAPPGQGTHAGTVTAQLATASGNRTVSVECRAEVEDAALSVQTLNVAFGDVLPGTTADRTITVSNASTVTTLGVSGLDVPDAAFTLTDTLPVLVPPGQSRDLTLRYAPNVPGVFDTTVGVVSEAGTTTVGVTATTGGEEIIDLGTQNFDGTGDTAEMSFEVPADAIAFTIEGRTNTSTRTGLRLLTGPGGRVYENENLTGAYLWRVNNGFHLSQVPNTDRPEVQLVEGGGTYRLKLWRISGGDPSVDVRVIIERRPAAGTDVLGTIDLNVFLADAITPTAATAAGDSTLQTVFSTIDTILAPQGLRLGDIDYYDIGDARYDDVTFAEFGPMLATSSAATETRLNLFFVREAIGGGILGVAATLGGPAVNGTQLSGVMSLYSTGNPAFIGLVAAHEIGHFIGLAHTVEQNGSHDDILDTDECPATGTNATCPTTGGGYLMHWQAVGGTTISDGQGAVIRGHPLIGPRLATPPLNAIVQKPRAPFIHVDPTVPQTWCGTCNALDKGR